MTDFDKKFLLKYISLVKKNQNTLTLSIMLNSTNRIAEKTRDLFFHFLETFSTNLLDEYIQSTTGALISEDSMRYVEEIKDKIEENYEGAVENSLQGIMYDLCVYVFEDVLVYLILNPSKNGNELINYIISNKIETVIDRLYQDPEYATQVIRYYTKYLVSKANLLITDKQEEEIWNKFPIINKLFLNKGYITLNDIARDTLIDIYEDTNKIYGDADEDKVHMIYDEFFTGHHQDHYLEQNNFDINDQKALNRFKFFMVRVILSDAYLNLKLTEMDYPDEVIENSTEELNDFLTPNERKALEYIEKCVEDNKYRLPKNHDIRAIIYEHFLYYNINYDIKNDLSFLENEEDMKKVLKINPFVFYD